MAVVGKAREDSRDAAGDGIRLSRFFACASEAATFQCSLTRGSVCAAIMRPSVASEVFQKPCKATSCIL